MGPAFIELSVGRSSDEADEEHHEGRVGGSLQILSCTRASFLFIEAFARFPPFSISDTSCKIELWTKGGEDDDAGEEDEEDGDAGEEEEETEEDERRRGRR